MTANDVPALFSVYARATASLVHGFAATEAEFTDAMRSSQRHLSVSRVFVACWQGEPVGFVRAGVYRPSGDRWSLSSAGNGLVLGPFFDPDNRGVGDALLDASRQWLQGTRAQRVSAFDPVDAASMPFYNGGWCGLSERMPVLLATYARAGFRIEHRELCMTRQDLPIDLVPEAPGRMSLVYDPREPREPQDRRRCAIRVWDRGAAAGTCYYSRMYPARSARPQAINAGYIDGLSVVESYRGRGLGRLLLKAAIARLRDMGCATVSLTTAATNLRAQNLYYSMSFELTDSCVALTGNIRIPELVQFA